MYLLAIAVAPALAIILFILYRDKLNREPADSLFASFLWGVLSTVPALVLEMSVGDFDLNQSIGGTIVLAFLGVALVEELVKFFPLRFYAFTRRSFDEPLDGIVHGVMIGMGFATLENLLYVFQHGAETGFLRMFTAVPGHASWGVIMGYYAGKAKFDYGNRSRLLLTGLVLATVFHGLYDGCLFLVRHVNGGAKLALAAAALATHAVAVVMAARLIRQHRRVSKGLYRDAPSLSFRYASVTDVPLIRTLARQIWPQTYEKILALSQIRYMMQLFYSQDSLEKQMLSGHRFLIVYNAAVPVGFASFGETEPSVYKLHKIYLLLNQQGRGTGRFTVETVIAEARANGATVLRLNVNRHNKARGFYERLGFRVAAEETIDIGEGYVMDDFVLEMNLAEIAASSTTPNAPSTGGSSGSAM